MDLFAYANQLQDHADKLDKLDRQQEAEKLRLKARELATGVGEALLARFEPQLMKLNNAIKELDESLNDIAKHKALAQVVNKVVSVATEIITII